MLYVTSIHDRTYNAPAAMPQSDDRDFPTLLSENIFKFEIDLCPYFSGFVNAFLSQRFFFVTFCHRNLQVLSQKLDHTSDPTCRLMTKAGLRSWTKWNYINSLPFLLRNYHIFGPHWLLMLFNLYLTTSLMITAYQNAHFIQNFTPKVLIYNESFQDIKTSRFLFVIQSS